MRRIRSTQELLESSRPKTRHPIVRLCEENGYEVTQSLERGSLIIVSKPGGFPKAHLHFMNRTFLSCYVHLSPEKNIGKLREDELRSFFDDGLCLSEFVESWAQSRWCKSEAGHAGVCRDADGPFPTMDRDEAMRRHPSGGAA